MAKAKSSASSATRKKHAAKQAKKQQGGGEVIEETPQEQPTKMQRGQKKNKQKKDRFAPKVKSYVPPPPPPKGQPDPVDLFLVSQGKQIDPELVVVLRRLGKKDEATVGKGVEAFESVVMEVLRKEREKEGEDWERELKEEEIIECMAVWAHHFPRLALHPSRRLRLAVHSLHSILVSASTPLLKYTRSALLAPLWIEQTNYVGAWCVAAFDSDRTVRGQAHKSWESVLLSSERNDDGTEEEGIRLIEQAEPITQFAFSVILASSSTDSDSVSDPTMEDPAFLRTSAISALVYLVQKLPSPLPLEEGTIETLTSEEMWDLISVRDQDKTGEKEQPKMVRRALYELLGAFAARKEDLLVLTAGGGGQEKPKSEEEDEDDVDEEENDDRLRTISRLVLDNCWTEEEGWPGIVSFLRRYPQAWTLADIALDPSKSASVSADEEDEDDDDTSTFTASPTFSRMLTHLSLACSSHPTSLYPTILLVLSTIPPSILPTTGPNASTALSLLFEHFYSAYASRAISIGGPQASEAWLSALLECLVYETSKTTDNLDLSRALSKEWFGTVWKAFLGVGGETKTRGLATRRTGEEFEKALTRFALREDQGTFEAVWKEVEEQAGSIFEHEGNKSKSLDALTMACRAFLRSTSKTVVDEAQSLVKSSTQRAVTSIQQGSEDDREDLLKFLIGTKDLVKGDAEIEQLYDDLALQHLPALVPTSSNGLTLLFSHLATTSSESRSSIWKSLFATSPAPIVFLRLIDGVQQAGLAKDLPTAELDSEVLKIAHKAFDSNGSSAASEDEIYILRKLSIEPHPFVEADLPLELVNLAVAALAKAVSPALSSSSRPTSSSLSPLVPSTALLANYAQLPENAEGLVANEQASRALFEVAYVLPNCRLDVDVPGEAIAAAQQAWSGIVQSGGDMVIEKVVASLKEQLIDASARPSAIEIVQACSDLFSTFPSTRFSLSDLLPSPQLLNELYDKASLSEPCPSLSIIEPLVSSSDDASALPAPSKVDSASLTSYPRAVLAFLDIASRDHSLARKSLWTLPHLLLVLNCAKDQLSLSSRSTGMFGESISEEVLERLIGAAEGASSYLLSSASNSLPDGWHTNAVTHVRAKESQKTDDQFLSVVDGLIRGARSSDAKGGYAQRAVATVLSATLRYSEAGVQDAERWLAFAQNLTSAPGLACAILESIKPILLETPRYERYQNELAANLAGVPPSQLESKGLPILRQLLASAPPPDAPIIFLPQQRTMFLMQAIQKWVGSDEGIPGEANAGVVELLSHLVAIVQDLSGSHWDLVFDLIESNLDSADWEEAAALPAIYQSCLLLSQMKELSGANAELRSVVKSRIDTSLGLVLSLFVSRPVSRQRNAPRAQVVATMARLVKDLPPKLLTMDKSFEQLLRLLQDPSLAVQVSSYDLLKRVVQRHVEELVVEAELDVEEKIQIELPASLVRLLEAKLSTEDVDGESKASTYLLSWLTTFAFFGPASPRIRSAYIEQLRNADLVASSLLPSLFSLFNLSDRTRPTDLSPWSIDDFHLELIDSLDSLNLPVFAAHVYYRSLQAVPSLIRTYWASLQNLQLSRTIQTFTSRNFSPLLIASELWSLRDPSSDTGKQLRDNDDFTVKVAAGANEVKCVFVVDEESMEIGVKVPNEFPLVGVEVKDVRKVGVTDKQWRAWLLAMQQVISTQSAAIADALLLFKRNVTLHFEGVESCAICYSTVSTVDRSLPSKTCKTCANKFHAGCLYKWFQTSHGSSCPLCRQIM